MRYLQMSFDSSFAAWRAMLVVDLINLDIVACIQSDVLVSSRDMVEE